MWNTFSNFSGYLYSIIAVWALFTLLVNPFLVFLTFVPFFANGFLGTVFFIYEDDLSSYLKGLGETFFYFLDLENNTFIPS